MEKFASSNIRNESSSCGGSCGTQSLSCVSLVGGDCIEIPGFCFGVEERFVLGLVCGEGLCRGVTKDDDVGEEDKRASSTSDGVSGSGEDEDEDDNPTKQWSGGIKGSVRSH